MSMKLPVKGGGDFKTVPAGSHMAVCTQLVDIGLQPGSGQYPAPKHKIILRFEIPAERVEVDGKDMPAVISQRFTASMSEKSNLRALIQSWSGKKFSDAEAEEFDIERLVGKSAMLTVIHSERGGKTYADIKGIGPLPKGVPEVKPEGELFVYSDEDKQNYDKLTKFVKELVDNQIRTEVKAPASSTEPEDSPFNDDIPF